MYKIVAIISAKDGISRKEFLHYWNVEHPELVWKLPGLRRYRQNHSIEHKTDWPFGGVAELWFDSLNDIRIAYAGPEAKAVFDHEEHFVGDLKWSITEEHEIPRP